jgi:hypothetical protein
MKQGKRFQRGVIEITPDLSAHSTGLDSDSQTRWKQMEKMARDSYYIIRMPGR